MNWCDCHPHRLSPLSTTYIIGQVGDKHPGVEGTINAQTLEEPCRQAICVAIVDRSNAAAVPAWAAATVVTTAATVPVPLCHNSTTAIPLNIGVLLHANFTSLINK